MDDKELARALAALLAKVTKLLARLAPAVAALAALAAAVQAKAPIAWARLRRFGDACRRKLCYAHRPLVLNIDAVPNLNAPDFRVQLAKLFALHVPEAAGDDHEQVAKVEAAQDPMTRDAEAMLLRAPDAGRGFFLVARRACARVALAEGLAGTVAAGTTGLYCHGWR